MVNPLRVAAGRRARHRRGENLVVVEARPRLRCGGDHREGGDRNGEHLHRGDMVAQLPRVAPVDDERFELMPVGRVESPLRELADAPKQGDEGAPDAVLLFAIDGTPIVDLKPVLSGDADER